jgi:hypothetical protein
MRVIADDSPSALPLAAVFVPLGPRHHVPPWWLQIASGDQVLTYSTPARQNGRSGAARTTYRLTET